MPSLCDYGIACCAHMDETFRIDVGRNHLPTMMGLQLFGFFGGISDCEDATRAEASLDPRLFH